MRCYKGIKFVNDVGTQWTAIKCIHGEDWEFISDKNNRVIYNYKSFYRETWYTLSRWKIVHNFNGYLRKL